MSVKFDYTVDGKYSTVFQKQVLQLWCCQDNRISPVQPRIVTWGEKYGSFNGGKILFIQVGVYVNKHIFFFLIT